jgi:hypothetical protein
MKVAIIFAGLPRLSTTTMPVWQKFVNRYNADTFIHTWENDARSIDQLKKDINRYLKPRSMIIEPQKVINTDLYNDSDRIWPYRSTPKTVMSMWYSIYTAFDLCDRWSMHKNETYDIVCRARFDWWCENIDLEIRDGLTVPDDPGLSGHIFNFRGHRYTAHNDQFGYGNQHVMREYANTYKSIPWLYMSENIDFCSELMLTANMLKQQIPVHYQKLNYRIMR